MGHHHASRVKKYRYSYLSQGEDNPYPPLSFGCNKKEVYPYSLQPEKIRIRALSSRYHGKHHGATFAMPVTEICVGSPGCGELKNPETIYRENERFFQIPVPSGGRTCFNLEFSHVVSKENLEIWCIGYETASLEHLERPMVPEPFTRSLPPQHPEGFPHAVKLKFSNNS